MNTYYIDHIKQLQTCIFQMSIPVSIQFVYVVEHKHIWFIYKHCVWVWVYVSIYVQYMSMEVGTKLKLEVYICQTCYIRFQLI